MVDDGNGQREGMGSRSFPTGSGCSGRKPALNSLPPVQDSAGSSHQGVYSGGGRGAKSHRWGQIILHLCANQELPKAG